MAGHPSSSSSHAQRRGLIVAPSVTASPSQRHGLLTPNVSHQIVGGHHHGQGFSSSHRTWQVVASSHHSRRQVVNVHHPASRPPPRASSQRLTSGRGWLAIITARGSPPIDRTWQVVASSHRLTAGRERPLSSSVTASSQRLTSGRGHHHGQGFSSSNRTWQVVASSHHSRRQRHGLLAASHGSQKSSFSQRLTAGRERPLAAPSGVRDSPAPISAELRHASFHVAPSFWPPS